MAHAATFRNDFLSEHRMVLAASVALHLALLVLLALNLDLFQERTVVPTRLAIEATVVDPRAMRSPSAAAAERQRQALEKIAERQKAEQREADRRLKVAEQERVAEQQKREQAAEAQKREEAQKAEEATRVAKAKAKAEDDRKAKEAQKLAAAEAAKKAEAERRTAQSKADLARALAEEEDLDAAASSGELAEYLDLIRQRVQRNWNQPLNAHAGESCDVRVQQIPGGEVTSAVAVNCTGDAAFARSVEDAVRRSSPLPLPKNPRLFERNLLFNFKPEQ